MTHIANTVNIMAIIQSSPIDMAAKSERNWLFVLVAWVIFSAVITGLLTILLYKKTSSYQLAVQRRADTLIAGSNAEAKRAGERAAEANERAQKLEGVNLSLRSQVATLETQATDAKKDLAILQMAAADANAAQQRVETDLAEARRRQAEAELKVEDVTKSQMPRIFSFNFAKFSASLKGKPTGHAILIYQRDDVEAYEFACKLYWVLTKAGWTATAPKPTEPSELQPSALVAGGALPTIWPRSSGVELVAKDIVEPLGSTKTVCGVLTDAFFTAGLGGGAAPDDRLPDNVVRLVIGQRQ